MLENFLAFMKHFPEFNAYLTIGLLIFSRLMGFVLVAPIVSRKDIPGMIKLCFSFLMTIAFIGILPPEVPPPDNVLAVSIILNFFSGLLIGYIAALIFASIIAAGDMINMQMGLSSAMMFDAASKEQSTLVGTFFNFFGSVIFMNIGGLYWIISALKRSFDIFGLYGVSFPLDKVINLNYLTILTGNVLFIGIQIAAPVLIATLAMDTILGVVSRTAPQVNVFQLSFLFKPIVGVAIIIILLPLLIEIITEYFVSFSGIY